ncbi:MAG: patatin-like phospholipase family protein [Clostridia bacterium]|nr:patatin-like phospholipase family protein [Clostridia bacterium]
MSKKLGLALGGGGARGVAHIGVIKALEEEGITPYCISGTSMGAVVGGCYACGIDIDTIRDVVLKLKLSDLVDVDVAPYTRLSILRSKKLQKLFLQYIGGMQFSDLKIPFNCTAVDLYSGKLIIMEEGSVATAVQASASIPAVFRPVQYGDMLLVDGGVLCRVPVRQAKALGADVVIGIDAIKNADEPVTKVPNLIAKITRVFDIVDSVNTAKERSSPDYPCDLMLAPEMKDMSQYAVKNLDKAYAEGYDITKAHMDEIKKLLED